MRALLLVIVLGGAVWGISPPLVADSPEPPRLPVLHVRFVPPAHGPQEASGNILLLYSEKDYSGRPDRPGALTVYTGVIRSIREARLEAGQRVATRLPELEGEGPWTVCAYIDSGRNFMQSFAAMPGDWYSGHCLSGPELVDGAEIVIEHLQGTRSMTLPEWFVDKAIQVQGRDGLRVARFLVGLPPGYESSGEQRYPVLYVSHGFNGTRFAYLRQFEILRQVMLETGQAMIIVSLEASGPFGHHLFTNTEANGPMQDAFEHSIVPYVDREYRTVASRDGRAFWGHSSGGWAALSLLLKLPDVVGYGVATSPDPIHLRPWWFHHPTNAYLDDEGQERLLINIPGRATLTFREFILQEVRTGSFGQFAGIAAVYSPFTPENVEMPFMLPFDLETGELDPEVWAQWERRDLYLWTKAHPEQARRALAGRFSLYVGAEDEFGLYPPAREYSVLLDEMAIAHTFEAIEGATHGDYVGTEAFLRSLWTATYTKMRPE